MVLHLVPLFLFILLYPQQLFLQFIPHLLTPHNPSVLGLVNLLSFNNPRKLEPLGRTGLNMNTPTTSLIAFGFPMHGLCLWLTVNLACSAWQQSPLCGIPVILQACTTHMLISWWLAHLKCCYRTTCHACDTCLTHSALPLCSANFCLVMCLDF